MLGCLLSETCRKNCGGMRMGMYTGENEMLLLCGHHIANLVLASRIAVIFKSHSGYWYEEISRMPEEDVWLHANRRC